MLKIEGKGLLLGNDVRSSSWDYILPSFGTLLIDFRLNGSSWLLQLMCTIKAWEQALFLWKRMQMYAKLFPKGFKFRFTVFLLTKDPAHCDQGHSSKNQNHWHEIWFCRNTPTHERFQNQKSRENVFLRKWDHGILKAFPFARNLQLFH